MDNESVEFDFEDNLDKFYPGFRNDGYYDEADEKMKPISFRPSDGFYSRYNKIAHRDWRGKKCQFFRNSDARVSHSVQFSDATYRTMDTLLNDLSEKMGIPFGVRSIHTPKSGSEVKSLDELQHGRAYICREFNQPRPLDLKVWENNRWNNRKPVTSQDALTMRLKGTYLDSWWYDQKMKHGRSSSESRQMGFKPPSPKGEEEMLERTPKKFTVYKNGCWLNRHLVLLNKRLKFRPNEDYFALVLQDIGEMFHTKFVRLYTADENYREVKSVKDILEGPEVYIAVQNYGEEIIKPPRPLEPIGKQMIKAASLDPMMVDKSGVVRKGKSLGRWRVKVITADEEHAGTSSNITMWVYGEKRDSGPLELIRQNHNSFSRGSAEEVDVKTGKVGAIYKIRLESDYSGKEPDWKCVEIQMTDINTEKSLIFPVNSWLSLKYGDGSTSKEIPMLKKNGEPLHPMINYEVLVATGDRWGAGTDAEPCITLIGERGDTGARNLLHKQAKLKQSHSTRGQYKPFKKHQIDVFNIEAVSLGRLKKIKIGHNKTKPGEGWFLDKVAVNITDSRDGTVKTFNFPCARWLDTGQDDGKLVREIFASEQQTGLDAQKEIWEIEQWKYEKDNELVLINEASGRALQIKGDATFSATGQVTDPFCVMIVKSKLPNGVRVFRSGLHSGYHLGIEKGKIYAEMRGGSHCEFKIMQQKDRSVCFQSVKYPNSYLTFDANGQSSSVNSKINSELKFRVYCRGAFRNDGVIIIQTSSTQTLFIDDDYKLVGYGVRDIMAYFRVHKIRRGVRMFQSVYRPDSFIQIKNGVCDGNGKGDEYCHFFVERNRHEGGSFRLISAVDTKQYLGLTPEGNGMAADEDDVQDLSFYPEVIEFGIPRKKRPDFRSSMTTPRTLHLDTNRGSTTRRSQFQNHQTSSRFSTTKMSTTGPKTPQTQTARSNQQTARTEPRTPTDNPNQIQEEPKTPHQNNQQPMSSTSDTEDPKSPVMNSQPPASQNTNNRNESPAKSPATVQGSEAKTPGTTSTTATNDKQKKT